MEAGVSASVATEVNDIPSNAIDTLSNAPNAQKVKLYQHKFPQDNICQGILANQDFDKVNIQKGLF
jgi:hypothetical protein